MRAITVSPSIVGVPLTFDEREVEYFFRLRDSTPRRAGKKRKFSFVTFRATVAEKVMRIILHHHHGGSDLNSNAAERLYQSVRVIDFHLSRGVQERSGASIEVKYRIEGKPGWWRQTFHFVPADTSVNGGLAGKLYTGSRRFHDK